MIPQKLLLLCYITLPCLISMKAVKIGVSKPLTTTTTVTPNTTSLETTVTTEEDIETELPTTLATSTTQETTITTPITSTATSEGEWPEFPPRKYPVNKTTTTRKPLRTSKKPKTTTTASPTTTTEATEISNKTVESPPLTLGLPTSTWNPRIYCFCDVTAKDCDINCCCDPDCPADVLKVFKCLKEDTTDFEINEGRFEDFKFQHGLPSCEVNDGWLCVFRSNMPPIGEKAHPSSFDTSDYYKWPNMLKEDVGTENREFYMYGDALKLINVETKDIRNFDLPSSLNSHLCQSKEPIMHLKSQKRACIKTTTNIQLKFWEIHDKYKILRKPTITEDVQTSKQLEDYVANITLRWCNETETLHKCQKVNEQHVEYMYNLVLSKIRIHIFHNFTNIFGILIDLCQKEGESEPVEESWLIYEVIFLNKTMTEVQEDEHALDFKDHNKITSGPLGYTLGKPLILAKNVPFNKSLPLSDKNQELNYFSDDNNQKNIWSIFKKHKGLCKRFELVEMEEYISYGINLAKQCKIRMNNETLLAEDPSKVNFSQVCLSLQDLIHRQLLGHRVKLADLASYFVSQLGKPQNITDKWLTLNVFNADFNPVFGQYMENSRTFICRNILLSLSYQFHIGTFDVDGVADQHIIKNANLLMGERHDLEFSLDELIEVPLTFTVRFYDVNEKAASVSSYLWISLIMYLINLVVVLNV